MNEQGLFMLGYRIQRGELDSIYTPQVVMIPWFAQSVTACSPQALGTQEFRGTPIEKPPAGVKPPGDPIEAAWAKPGESQRPWPSRAQAEP